MNPYAIIGALVLAISLCTGSYFAGWENRGNHEAAITLEKERDAALKAEELRVAAAIALKKETDRANTLAGELDLEKQNIKTVTIEKIKEVPVVTTVYKESPNAPAQPIPDAIFTTGFVRLWNDAYGPTASGRRPIEPADPSGEADLVRAKVTSADILNNHIDNAGKHAACYAQLNKLIDFELGRAPPAPVQ